MMPRGLKGPVLYYSKKIIHHLECALSCHAKAMGRGEVTNDPQWYRNARREHMQLARKYRDKLRAESNQSKKEV